VRVCGGAPTSHCRGVPTPNASQRPASPCTLALWSGALLVQLSLPCADVAHCGSRHAAQRCEVPARRAAAPASRTPLPTRRFVHRAHGRGSVTRQQKMCRGREAERCTHLCSVMSFGRPCTYMVSDHVSIAILPGRSSNLLRSCSRSRGLASALKFEHREHGCSHHTGPI
jgi:hypothetical protein